MTCDDTIPFFIVLGTLAASAVMGLVYFVFRLITHYRACKSQQWVDTDIR